MATNNKDYQLIPCEYEASVDKCLKSIKLFRNSSIVSDGSSNGIIVMKLGMLSLRTFGEEVSISVFKSESNKNVTNISIESKNSPCLFFTDFGKNKENVSRIKNYLSEQADFINRFDGIEWVLIEKLDSNQKLIFQSEFKKQKLIPGLGIFLSFVFGTFGWHKFYMKSYGIGVFYIFLGFFGISTILGFIDSISIASDINDFNEAKARELAVQIKTMG